MTKRTLVYVSWGNSDDKLTQAEWSAMCVRVVDEIQQRGLVVHVIGYSAPASVWQNACAGFEVDDSCTDELKQALGEICGRFRQDGIVWAPVPALEMISSGWETL